jgi:hypothetical protein
MIAPLVGAVFAILFFVMHRAVEQQMNEGKKDILLETNE